MERTTGRRPARPAPETPPPPAPAGAFNPPDGPSARRRPGVRHAITPGRGVRRDNIFPLRNDPAPARDLQFSVIRETPAGRCCFATARTPATRVGAASPCRVSRRSRSAAATAPYTMFQVWGGITFQPGGGQRNPNAGVWLADLSRRPDLGGARSARAEGRAGRPAHDLVLADGRRVSFYVEPVDIPTDVIYASSDGTGSLSYYNYGDMFARRGAHGWTRLSWSWVTTGRAPQGAAFEEFSRAANAGGRIVRATLARGEVFYPSNVEGIVGYDARGGSGWVRAVYGRVWTGAQSLYGWLAHSHYSPSEGEVRDHLRPRTPRDRTALPPPLGSDA